MGGWIKVNCFLRPPCYNSAMTKEKLKHFQDLLETEKRELEEKLSALGHRTNESGDWVATPVEQDGNEADYLDQATHVEAFEDRVGALTQLEKQYSDITRALEKIANGTYGTCEISGDKIEEDRLEANPSARTCKKHMNDRIEE